MCVSEHDLCFPFRVAYNDAVGHYLVAIKDLAPLDLVLRESSALPSGTLADTRDPTCLSCYSVLVKEQNDSMPFNYAHTDQRVSIYSLCPNCNLPVCKTDNHDTSSDGNCISCHENDIHKNFECKLFQERKINLNIKPDSRNHPFYKVNYTLQKCNC